MYWKLLEIGVFSLSNTGLGVAKLMDIGSKLLATVGVALTDNPCLHWFVGVMLG